ncbi:hypothetical protein ZWY2020_045692 [Hordeum vulgare]|nr:hypothetical protein ZWY2020_045692 [Hordeum vulgare]
MSGDAGTPGTSNNVAAPKPAEAGEETTGIPGTSRNSTNHVVISMARPPFRDVNEDLFKPLSVPIGPYHRDTRSEIWKPVKKSVAEKIESLVGGECQLRDEVGELEQAVRECYGGLDNMNRDELVDMLLEDGCYVLSLFVVCPELLPVSTFSRDQNTVMRDTMYLLENQLPMIVLELIHKCVWPRRSVSVLHDVEMRVRELLKKQLYIGGEGTPRGEQAEPGHLLQLVHAYFQPQLPDPLPDQDGAQDAENTPRQMGRWRRATEYSRYGNVQLKRRDFQTGVVESILDVRLEGGTLWIPTLRIDSSTWTILRNLMALEEHTGTCPSPGTGAGGSPVTAYCMFMSQLASKEEDTELLKRNGILDHSWGTDEEVARGFADLWKKAILDVDNVGSNYLGPIWYQLHSRCKNRGHNFLGSFRHIHCGDSMRILAFFTAGLLFAFQLIQVIFAGFSLRQHGK